ncbi:MAG: MFS transporter, partial [Cyclobacteriaceae bacterium]|nr:MFS transporter [Cyclobacteriaceae bacterium]
FLGSLSCIGLFFFDGNNVEWGIMCSVFASVGYSASLVFYDAFLPEITTPDQTDRVSARGYSMGYLGGVVLLVINLVTIQFWDSLGFESQGFATRLAFLTVGVWWMFFGLLSLSRLPSNVFGRKPSGGFLLNGYRELRKVWMELKKSRNIRYFLLAFFFYNTGVQTIMYLAATFGSKELKMDDGKLIMTVLVIQFLGIAGAYLFAHLSRRRGNVFSLMVMTIIWVGICVFAYFISNEPEFYVLAACVGLVMGGIQSLSRATFSKLIPVDSIDHASYFSFYDVTYNVSIVLGTFSYGLVEQLTGSMRNSTLALGTYFFVGLLFLFTVKLPHVTSRPAQA